MSHMTLTVGPIPASSSLSLLELDQLSLLPSVASQPADPPASPLLDGALRDAAPPRLEDTRK